VIRVATVGFALLLCAPAAFAQTPAAGPSRWSVSGGLSWLGRYPAGSGTATLRRNEPGTTTPGSFTLFDVDTSIERALGVDARLAYALARAFDIEVGGAFSQPRLAASITGDEEADSIELTDQRLTQFTLTGSLVWHVMAIDLGFRARPYVIGGLGYLREIDDERAQAERGTVGHIGGGVNYWPRGDANARHGFGLRGEARLQIRSGGFEFEDKVRVGPSVAVLGTFAF
jgi:hypothetical protein